MSSPKEIPVQVVKCTKATSGTPRVLKLRPEDTSSGPFLWKHGTKEVATPCPENGTLIVNNMSMDDLGNYSVEVNRKLQRKTYLVAMIVPVLTLDPDTAHKNLSLSGGNKKVTRVEEDQPYTGTDPTKKKRFTGRWPQVLCTKSLPTHFYWEVEWSGKVCIAVTDRRINKDGDGAECELSKSTMSCCLDCDESKNKYVVSDIEYDADHAGLSRRVAVYVEEGPAGPAGTSYKVSFYKVYSDKTTLLRPTQSYTFPEPPYAGFELLESGSSVTLCQT